MPALVGLQEKTRVSRSYQILAQTYVKNNISEWTDVKSMRAASRKQTSGSPGVPS
jgi:hypothetical protein